MPSHKPKGSKSRGGVAKPKVGKLVSKAVEAAAKKPKKRIPAPPVTRNNDLPEFVLKIKRKPSYKKGPFDRKVNALKKLSDEGKLFKQANPVARDPELTKAYRQRVREAIFKKYWPPDGKATEEGKAMANKLLARLGRLDTDHVWDPQLGGPDTVDNLRLLDSHTNQDLGNEFWQQIGNLPDGTPIRIEVIP
ncbi:endonuclease [Micromonospora sp. PLK6-60]|uniref:endonuclease n=1 Tax=Micromonospora sp. PLK6-60 TaxID=2873383 RepID=UPI001CA64E7F|nr:endonuclease [Micromonospora sp. PLK6-60]MBY8875050.1 endonuclease [Micromonospora sp. PLK6-60]